jgi:teichuronic acid biosynthesis glycosyltransferase TuaC
MTNMYPTPTMPAFGVFVADQVAALRQAGVAIDVLFINGKSSTSEYARGFGRLWRALRAERYDLIHAHYVFSGIIARAQFGIPVVVTYHGSELLGHPRWQTWLSHVVTPLFDEVIYVSNECREAMRDRDGWVIPCGIDVDGFTPVPRELARQRLGLAPDQPLVLWAGDPNRPEKRFWLAEQAMQHVQNRLPNAGLVVLAGRPHAEVPTYMSACDVLVLTSAAEGSPMVVKEAMAANLPIVSVRVGDVPEVIGETPGCALATRDPRDIASRLLTVLHERRRTDGRMRIQELRQERIAQRILQVYEHALGARRDAEQYAPG